MTNHWKLEHIEFKKNKKPKIRNYNKKHKKEDYAFNQLCLDCNKECKQWYWIKILVCPNCECINKKAIKKR